MFWRNQRFSNILSGYGNGRLGKNRLKCLLNTQIYLKENLSKTSNLFEEFVENLK